MNGDIELSQPAKHPLFSLEKRSVISCNPSVFLLVDIMTPTDNPIYRSKADLEVLVKKHGGMVYQSETARKNIFVIADKSNDPP